jgi:ABC-2 type transport system permease protein
MNPSIIRTVVVGLAAIHTRHHGVRIVLPILLIIIVAGGVILLAQRRRDRRPLDEVMPSPAEGARSLGTPNRVARAATDGDDVLHGADVSGRSPESTQPAVAHKHLPPGRYGISGLLRSEWTKLRSVRSTMWTLGITIVLGIGVSVLATAETRAHWLTTSAANRQGFDPISTSLIGVFIGQFAIGILGVLVMSGEYGTGTIRATFSAAPRRPLVLVAKAIVFGVVALIVAEVVSFLAFFVGQALLTAPTPHATLASPGAWRSVVGSGLYVGVLGLFSLGLATIVRHTAGAISAFVGILLVLPLVVQALPSSVEFDVRRFLPDRIGAQMLKGHANGFPGSFSPWIGLLILCGYAAVLLVIGGMLLVRRDA